jgi:deazaflavin-dependent oxidoreductase (nitroreductase family)
MSRTFGERFGNIEYCYLTTTGRQSGQPRTIEIWFAFAVDTLYLLAGSGERAHWVRNLRRTPAVQVKLGDDLFDGTARVVARGSDEDALARRLLVEKYTPRYSGDLTDWGRTALPVAVEFTAPPTPHG